MLSNKEIFQQFADKVVPELKSDSKRFANSIESEVTNNELKIVASPFIRVLIDGRRPTSPTAVKGNPTLQQIMRKWIDDNSITPKIDKNGNIPTKDQLSWMFSNSMHVKGDLLYQRVSKGGQKNLIFDSILTPQRIEDLLTLLSNKFYTEVISIVKK